MGTNPERDPTPHKENTPVLEAPEAQLRSPIENFTLHRLARYRKNLWNHL